MLRFDERVHLPKNRENTITFLVNGEPIGTVETLAPGAKTVDIPIPPVNYDSVTNALGYVPQEVLISGSNIKTINNTSLLGSGNIDIQGGGSSYTAGNGIDITNDVISIDNTVALKSDIPTEISDLVDDTATTPIDKAESVVDNNSGSLKFWSGTKAQYDAIATKDADTLYNITDDANPTLSILEMLYPVGSIYIGTMSVCPLQTLGVGTWQLVATDRVLQGAGTRGNVGGTISESLPNITGNVSSPKQLIANYNLSTANGAFSSGGQYGNSNSIILPNDKTSSYQALVNFNAHNSNATYQDNAPVQQDAYLVNIWERIL